MPELPFYMQPLLPWQRDVMARLQAGQKITLQPPARGGKAARRALIAQLNLIHAVLFTQYARTYWRENLLELTTGECLESCEYNPGDYDNGIAASTLHAPACPQVNLVYCECWPLVTALGQPPEMERNPDCRLHWAEVHLIPCCCEYLLRHVHGAPGPYVPYRRPWMRRVEWLTRCFVIHPDCHWHGEDALPDSPWGGVFGLEGEADMEPPAEIASCSGYIVLPAEDVLDENERRDH